MGELTEGPIPKGVYYSPESRNFYRADIRQGMGLEFWWAWRDRCRQFPQNCDDARSQSTPDILRSDDAK